MFSRNRQLERTVAGWLCIITLCVGSSWLRALSDFLFGVIRFPIFGACMTLLVWSFNAMAVGYAGGLCQSWLMTLSGAGGFDLGAQRRPMDKNDLPQVAAEIADFLGRLRAREPLEKPQLTLGLIVAKEKIAGKGSTT